MTEIKNSVWEIPKFGWSVASCFWWGEDRVHRGNTHGANHSQSEIDSAMVSFKGTVLVTVPSLDKISKTAA